MTYQTRPKAAPGADRGTDTHNRVRHDRIDQSGSVTLRVDGRLHHIGIGIGIGIGIDRTHILILVLVLVQELNIRIVDAATGEPLRELTLNPNTDYQPTGAPKGPRTKKPRTQ